MKTRHSTAAATAFLLAASPAPAALPALDSAAPGTTPAASAKPGSSCCDVEALLRGLESGGDPSPEAAFALRIAAEAASRAGGDVAGLAERIPESAQGDAWTDTRARLLHLEGRHSEAAALLEPLALPRHHTLPRWSIVHEHLGDAYAAMDQAAAAEGQWRVALATGASPDGSGWDPAAVEAKLAAAAAARGGAAPIVPVTLYPDAVYLIDLASIRGTAAGVRYEKVELLLHDDDGAAFSRFAREIDCGDEAQTRAEWRRRYAADGRQVEAPPIRGTWLPVRHDDPSLHTERRMVCDFPQGVEFRTEEMSDVERLQAFRRARAAAGD